jgi:NitT/TauT family transport system ATP-binding protein
MWAEHNMTILFITHDLEEALFLGTRILGLSQYYTDGRGSGSHVQRGARIKKDIPLNFDLHAINIKHSEEFLGVKEEIRRDVMEPDSIQHVVDFDLKHQNSFQTLIEEESQR